MSNDLSALADFRRIPDDDRFFIVENSPGKIDSKETLVQIAVLGTGHVGGTLGARWAQHGHKVCFGSRDPQSEKARAAVENAGENASLNSLSDATSGADVVVLAIPWTSVQEILESAGDLTGKVVVDCINPLNAQFNGLDLGFSESCAERIAELAPAARVVKAFNTASSRTMGDPDYGGQAATMFYCGDDEDAKDVVGQLAADLGFEPVDAGPLNNARYLEPFAMLYIHLAVKGGWGSNCAFKIMKR